MLVTSSQLSAEDFFYNRYINTSLHCQTLCNQDSSNVHYKSIEYQRSFATKYNNKIQYSKENYAHIAYNEAKPVIFIR